MTYLAVMLDPTAEATGTQLAVNDGAPGHSGYVVHAPIDMPHPPLTGIYASSVDTEGGIPAGLSYGNRLVSFTVRCYGTTTSDVELKIGALLEKLGKFQREGGTMLITLPSTRTVTFDVCPESQGDCEFGVRFLQNLRADVEIKLTCRPFVRWAEQSLGNFTETTLPVLQAVVSGIDGDQLANGRAVVTATAGDQWTVFTGVQSRFYDSSAHASLFYEAETRTPLGGAAIAAGASGASGAGSNVMRQGTLTTVAQAMMSTHSSAGTPLQHVGSFEVLARIYRPAANAGAVSLFLEWAAGDFQAPTQNDAISFAAGDWEDSWTLCSLGLVHLPKAVLGSQKWEGRIVAKSTRVGDDLDIDWIGLCPTTADGDVASAGKWSGIQTFSTPTSFTHRDEFEQSAGALTGKTLASGATWTVVASSDTDDFAIDTANDVATRSITTIDSAPRIVTAGTGNIATVGVQVDGAWISGSVQGQRVGAALRVVDINNYATVWLASSHFRPVINFQAIAAAGSFSEAFYVAPGPVAAGTYYTMRAVIDATGHWWVWAYPQGGSPGTPIHGYSSLLATGGTLATGKVGVFANDQDSATTNVSAVANFSVFTPTIDAACFASQSMQIDHKSVLRENSAGTFWDKVSEPRGRYLQFAPGGAESRSNRFFLKATRGQELQPNVWADPAIDDIAVDLFATPRGVAVPEP